MRQIKFRVWDKNERDWMSGWRAKNNQEWFNLLNIWDNYAKEEVVVEQFTGLLDKNGVEIYEGDICDWCSGRVIDYVELKKNEGWKMRDLYNLDWWENAEVIGNIHENPELLGEKK